MGTTFVEPTGWPRPFRRIWGPRRWIGGDAISVRLSAMRYTDGELDETDDDGAAILIDVCRDWGINTQHAREVAAAILAVADEADRLVAR
jgi:hypothetical protein